MKPTVVIDTKAAQEERAERERRTRVYLQQTERESARFHTINQMLSWFWAMRDHMRSPPAIDPSREIIQGLKVDRDERIFWVGATLKLLATLEREHGPRAPMLLWLRFRSPSKIGLRETDDGRKVEQYGLPPIAIRDLHEHDGENISRNATIADFWKALHHIEEMAFERGWVGNRIQRKTNRVQVYRREQEEPT